MSPAAASVRSITVRGSVPPLSLHAWLRFDAIDRLLPPDARTLLEIGAGQGSAGALLSRRFTYVGLEPDEESFRTAVKRIGAAGTVLNKPAETYEPSEPFLIPAALALEDVDGVAMGRVAYPPDEVETFDWSPTVLKVYRGTVELTAPFEVAAGATPGRRRVTGRMGYQGCTETLCYPPAEQEVTAFLQVV